MKEKEGYVDCPEQQMILYVEKENGRYGPIQTGSYITKHYIDDFFEKRRKLIDALRQQVENKDISPVKFFMVLEDLTLKELAARTRIPSRKVKKHLLWEHFGNISPDLLSKYADVFHVTTDQLLAIDTSTIEEHHPEELKR